VLPQVAVVGEGRGRHVELFGRLDQRGFAPGI